MRETWKSWRLLCLVPITAAIIFVAWRTQSEEPVITLAELPVEDEVTFDLETNPVDRKSVV